MKIDILRLKILDFARQNENIRAVIETGAFARDFPPADELSDLDLEFYAQNSQILLDSNAWIENFGPILICLKLPNEIFNPTRLVIYQSGEKVDFALYDNDLLQDGYRSPAQRRGCVIHLDKDGITQNWEKLAPPEVEIPGAATFRAAVDDFWFDTYNLAKTIARGDLWHAKIRDTDTKNSLLQMLEWHARAVSGADVWHQGHFLTHWSDETTLREVEEVFARYSAADTRRAMKKAGDLFGRLAREVATCWELEYPLEVENSIRELMGRMGN